MQSNDSAEIDLVQLKERFDRQLPKYGFLWKSMANVRLPKNDSASSEGGVEKKRTASKNDDTAAAKQRASAVDKENVIPPAQQTQPTNQKSSAPVPNLLNAILAKQPVSLRVHDYLLCGDDCNCADPIIEIDSDGDEDASVYDADTIDNGDSEEEELVDTDDEASATDAASEKNDGDELINNDLDNEAGSVQIENFNDTPINGIESDDDSIIILSKTPKKKKKVIVDSDDEDASDCETLGSKSVNTESEESDQEGEEGTTADDSFIVENEKCSPLGGVDPSNQDSLGPSSRRRTRSSNQLTRNSMAIPNTRDISDYETSKDESEEEEWIELSSDEEEEDAQPQRENTVVILSSDEEGESESDYEIDGQESAFTISDDDSISDCDSFDKQRRGGRLKTPPSGRSTGRQYTTRAAKPNNNNTKTGTNRRPQPQPPKKTTTGQKPTVAFRKNRDQLTRQTFAEFNNKVFKGALSSVEVSWSNKLNTTAGITRMRGKLGADKASTRVATIELATKVIDDEERLRSTLLHEMCHAAQWLVDGVHKPPHGKVFKKWASISMRRTDVEVTTTHDYIIAYKYAWACTAPNCSVIIKRHSRSVDTAKHCCGRCQGKLVEIEVPKEGFASIAQNGYTPKKQRKTSEYALFVKNQSASVRKNLAIERSCAPKEISQADVMKECGKMWRRRKADAAEKENEGGLENMANRLVNLTL